MAHELTATPKGRIVSIDALRGFDMLWITGGDAVLLALCNLIGGRFAETMQTQFEHCSWNGFRFYDLIFPLFLFIVGVSMVFSLYKRKERGEDKKKLLLHVMQRTVTLIILGFIYNGILRLDFSDFRYAGVLQRIALCYFFTSIIILNTSIRGQAITAGAILILYWAAMMLIPVPGFGAGVLTPEGNLSAWLDQKLLPGSFCCYNFGDNEGLLSTFPAIATCLLGVFAGHWLRSNQPDNKKVLGLVGGGVACLILGQLWGLVFPINKLIWTSSYVLYAGGWSMLLLALFYFIIDVKGYKSWAFFFVVIGLNPITIYIVQSQFDFAVIANIFVRGFIDHMGIIKPLFWASCLLAVRWLFLYFLHRQKIYLKA
jgi:predicted acyltransferase